MKFTVSSKKLVKAIGMASLVVGKNNTLPILDSVLFSVSGSSAVLTATDLETTLSLSVGGVCDGEGMFCVNARLAYDFLKLLPDVPVEMEYVNERVVFRSLSGEYGMASFNASEFPIPPAVSGEGFTIPSSDLKEAIKHTLFASGTDELRQVLSGVFFDNGTFVSTDAHKMVIYQSVSVGGKYIVPRKPLSILVKVLPDDGDVSVSSSPTNASFYADGITVSCRLIDGKYPNYNAVLPEPGETIVTINRKALLSSVKRVSVFASPTTHHVKFNIRGNTIKVSSQDTDFQQEAAENLMCSHNGPDMVIGFNGRFLDEVLSSVDSEDVEIVLVSPSKGVMFHPVDNERITMLLMPVMLIE